MDKISFTGGLGLCCAVVQCYNDGHKKVWRSSAPIATRVRFRRERFMYSHLSVKPDFPAWNLAGGF